MHKQVVSEIVDNDLCIGCGTCAGVCPSKLLSMSIRGDGDLAPILTGDCPPSCSLCLKVCPFDSFTDDENIIATKLFKKNETIAHDDALGFYSKTYVGYVNDTKKREQSSSGGMASWFLSTLLEKKHVDRVICVTESVSSNSMFEFKIFSDVKDVENSTGSRYYPVHLADVIEFVQDKKNEYRFAVVALPCAAKSIRLAMNKLPRLKRRIKCVVGLVCGHLPNANYTSYLSSRLGYDSLNDKNVSYRNKSNKDLANNFSFSVTSSDNTSRSVQFSGFYGHAWMNKYFQFNACNYCDDIFAETADVSFMDAWLPEYVSDYRGHSLIVVREPSFLEVFEDGKTEGVCTVSYIDPLKVVDSQSSVVLDKKNKIAGRLYFAKRRGERIPNKRIKPDKIAFMKNYLEIIANRAIQLETKTKWKSEGINMLCDLRLVFYSSFLSLLRINSRVMRVLFDATKLRAAIKRRISNVKS